MACRFESYSGSLEITGGPFWVYVLRNSSGIFYIGSTDNLQERIQQHNPSPEDYDGSKYTHKNGPWQLVWSESHPTRSSAVKRERQIKKMKSPRWIREKFLDR